MNAFRTAALMAVMMTLIALVGYMLGGMNWMIIAFGIAVAMNFFSYWYSDKIVLRMYKGQEVSAREAPELYDMVDRLRQKAGLPMPKVVVIPSDQPNAFATGRNPKNAAVAVTNGIVRQLSPRELEGVIAHELAHIQNRDILTASVAATIASAITLLARFAIFVPMGNRQGGGNIIGMILMLILAPIAAMLIQMAISRTREYSADRDGGRICGDPDALAGALLKLQAGAERRPMDANPSTAHMFIVNPLSGRRMAGFSKLFSTHPPTEERVRRLREQAGHRVA
jgi:heat shock protein HtpX